MSNPQYGRLDRLIKDKHHDIYYERGKRSSPTLCTECQALYLNGRWTWQQVPAATEVMKAICPACRRIADRYPAGYVKIKGAFYHEHQRDVLNLVQNLEKQEKSGHPMERLMTMKKGKDSLLLTTTGIHLARRIGEVLTRAYQGEVSMRYADDEHSIRVSWVR